MGKVKSSGGGGGGSRKKLRHDPLHVQLEKTDSLTVGDQSKGRGALRRGREKIKEQERERKLESKAGKFVSEKLSKKILSQARQQQEEIEEEEEEKKEEGQDQAGSGAQRKKMKRDANNEPRIQARAQPQNMDSDEDDEEENEIFEDKEEEEGFDERIENDIQNLEAEDEEILKVFMSKEAPARKTLADVIMEKVKEKETEIMTLASERGEIKPQTNINPKVVAVYEGVGKLLTRYRSGAIPKAFKILPSVSNWEEILYITNPDTWSTQAMHQATKIFASNLNAKMAQRFFNLVLLSRIREDFRETKKINYHLYMALRRALFKPGAFFKGILLPICEARDCSLREAAILGGLLTKASIPVLHSSAALLKIAEMEYSGVNSLFIRVLLDKKYALPYKVIDSLVFHFIRFQHDQRELPVLWHQSLLVFIQRYKEDITTEQKEAILELIKKQTHYQITNEIRREIQSSKSRGEVRMEEDIDLNFDYID